MERIIAAAYKVKPEFQHEGIVYQTGSKKVVDDIYNCRIGRHHAEILHIWGKEVDHRTDGFYTSYGRYVDREEAAKIALDCGQITRLHYWDNALDSSDVFDFDENEEKIINYDVVDLGLPSGTLWSKYNLGAEKETDFGLFYQWGDIKGHVNADKKVFDWDYYIWGPDDGPIKYNNTDNKLVLDDEDDPVYITTNGKMKCPSPEQLQELIAHTNHQWIENFEKSGISGIKLTSKSDYTKYIFIPAAGLCYESDHDDIGSCGHIWSSARISFVPKDTWFMLFDSGSIYMSYSSRCLGYNMRGVVNK